MSDRGLSVRDLGVEYGEATALRGVSFELAPASSIAVLGPNGAGKTTLARALAGLVKPATGEVEFDGRNVTGWPAHRIARLGITHIPETRGVFPGLSVLDNLKMTLRRAVPRSERRAAIQRAFDQFPILAERRQQRAATLSGGEQQMLALARTLVVPPRVLIADEISSGLAPIIVESVFEQLAVARAEGVALLIIEQFVDKALALCDDAVILRRGEIAWSGSAAAAHAHAAELYLGGVGEG